MRLNYDKILRLFFFVIILVLVITNIRQCAKSNQKNQYYIDRLNARSKSEIELRELHIKKLTKTIEYKDALIKQARFSIDSLEQLKGRVEVIYINRVQQINTFTSKQLENYWKDEIK
jgi:hypothetical protein